LSLHAHIVSVHSSPRLHCEPLKLLSFDFNADPDPDPAFHSNTDPDAASKNNVDPTRIRNDGHEMELGASTFTLQRIMIPNLDLWSTAVAITCVFNQELLEK
jgi:hypothetical protein